MKKKVVVTGIGVISPVGIGRDDYWRALFLGKSSFREITLFDTAPFRMRTAGEISDFDASVFLGKKGLRVLDRSTRLVLSAAHLAIEDSRLSITEENTRAIGVSIGSTFGSLHSISQFDRDGLTDGPRFVNPSLFPNTVLNSPASQVSIRFRIKGFNATISTGFCAALDAISYAADFIRMGRADIVLAGGVEELCEETFSGFYHLGCLSGIKMGASLSCPFDNRRDGFVFSEGAAVLVLEDADHALKRGMRPMAEIAGCGNAFNACTDRTFAMDGSGLRASIEIALKDSSTGADQIDYVSSCANSTPGLDRVETGVLKEVFGAHVSELPVSSIKSMIGESFSSSGAMSLAAGIGAIARGIIPPTVNYQEKDPACDLDYVTNGARQQTVGNVLVTAADPCGPSTAIVLRKFSEAG